MYKPLSDALKEMADGGGVGGGGGKNNWRDGLNSQTEVMSHALNGELFANAILIVGREQVKIRVIKELLQILSLQLEQRLSWKKVGQNAEEDGLPIFDFKDVDVEPMKDLINFAYTHQWTRSRKSDDLTPVLSFLRLAERFGVKHLAQKIQNSMVTSPNEQREQSIATARARVITYDESTKNWIQSDGGTTPAISRLHLYQNEVSNTYRILGRKVEGQTVILDCPISKGLKYSQATPMFHQFRTNEGQLHGLNFSDKNDAAAFASAVMQTVDLLNNPEL